MAAASFPMFPRLPAEIRSMIWNYALPEARVFEILDTPHANLRTPAEAGLTFANKCLEPPPSLAAVCTESRQLVLRHYKPLRLSGTTKYIDPAKDMILLEPYLLIRRLLRALHFLGQVPFIRDGVRQLALGTSYGFNTGIFHPILSGKVSKNNMRMLLSKLGSFPRLRKLLFIVHQEFQFGDPVLAVPGLSYRLQLFHHNYPFKYDTDLGARNQQPFYFHQNELRYYPFKVDDSKEDELDLADLEDDEEEAQERLPTNDDWRRFRRRFMRALYIAVEKGPKSCVRSDQPVTKIEGASLLWKYHRN